MVKSYPDGANVVITGASSGIGEACARVFANAGARVLLSARSVSALEEITKSIEETGKDASFYPADVTKKEEIDTLFAIAEQRMASVDIVIANAGVGMYKPIVDTTDEDLTRVLDINVTGVLRTIRAAVPKMKTPQKGQIILISSVVGKRGIPMLGGYSASKFALQGLSEALRVELKPKGIDVIVVCPGYTATKFQSNAIGASNRPNSPGKPMSAEAVALATLNASRKRKREVVLTASGKAAFFFNKVAPWLLDRVLLRVVTSNDNQR